MLSLISSNSKAQIIRSLFIVTYEQYLPSYRWSLLSGRPYPSKSEFSHVWMSISQPQHLLFHLVRFSLILRSWGSYRENRQAWRGRGSHVHQAHTHGLLSRHINARQWSPLNIFLSFPCSNVGNPIEYSFEVNQFPLFQFEAQRSLCKLSLRSRVSFLSYLFRLVPSQHYPEGVVGSNTSCPLLPARVHVRWIARRRFFIPSCRISRHTTEEYCLPSFNHASASTSALISSAVKSYRFTTNLYLYLFPSFSTFFAEIGYLHSAHVGHNSTCRSDGSRIRRRRIFWFRKYQKELEQRK